ncbi:PREDICTED: probable protein phosphatase 2C 23 [Brassica oleracea var. oleracea]|uniref:protein-serine/threonine phosphatase n=1 Tax=Brassica oleracea var. oleracea TaxID=109376 RepID=A0A0D2ZUZ8_BRAOL|nr:PREDICTED: probable protein phosphatase 2C 23 [Brassica oleracea var. oleracea]
MGNGITKLSKCFTGGGETRRKKEMKILEPDPLDEGLGHSFCYVRPDPIRVSSSKVHSEEDTTTTTFRTISGASVSANAATPLSTSLYDPYGHIDRAAAFESTTSFASIPLQPIPRSSGPIVPGSGPLERGFLSGPIERGFMSGPIDGFGLFSGPLGSESDQFQRSFSHGLANRFGSRKGYLARVLRRAISKTINRGQNSIVAPVKTVKEPDWVVGSDKSRNQQHHNENLTVNSLNFSSEGSLDDDVSLESQNLQWAQGKAGEDRVHVVVSEEHGWLFVGIYDGFNGPDAPDYLLSHLYPAVHRELKGLLWDDPKLDSNPSSDGVDHDSNNPCPSENCEKKSKNDGRKSTKCEESQRRWRCEWDRERLDLDRLLKEKINKRTNGSDKDPDPNSSDVLKALSEALRKTEEAYLENADMILHENPELALMGSCVLAMLMKGEDVYLMNVGDSRAVLGQKAETEYWMGKIRQDLERINEETMIDFDGTCEGERAGFVPNLSAFQLTVDHSTNVEEEVDRIRKEHPDDASAVSNERVKGSLKVTRAFGAGFLKQPKWNNALLEMFQIDYIGTSPYINCLPALYHHRLGSKDQFLILSSDGLYQYFTDEEAVSEVELFITLQPEGDPAQHLVQELLFRAAKKAGMDFNELLEIPQGERRRYHDDVSIVVISLEGRMWKSCV